MPILIIKLTYKGARPSNYNYDKVPARLIKIKYATTHVEKVASPITALQWALVSPDGVALSQMVGVSASVNLPLHHKVQKFSSDTGSPEWSWKKGHKTVVVVS